MGKNVTEVMISSVGMTSQLRALYVIANKVCKDYFISNSVSGYIVYLRTYGTEKRKLSLCNGSVWCKCVLMARSRISSRTLNMDSAVLYIRPCG